MRRRKEKGIGDTGAQVSGLFACGLLFLFSRAVLPELLLTARETSAGGKGGIPDGFAGALLFASLLLAALESARLTLVARARALSEGKRVRGPRLGDERRIGLAVLRERVFRAFASGRDSGATVGESFSMLEDAAAGTELMQGAAAARERLLKGNTFLEAVEGTGLLSANAEALLRAGADHRRLEDALRSERQALLERAERAGMLIVPAACWGLIAAAFLLLMLRAVRT